MCQTCWIEAGAPASVTPAVREVAALISRLDELCDNGGHLHIVTEDWNVEDEHLSFCLQEIEENTDPSRGFDDPELRALELRIVQTLLAMSEDERYSALALTYGLIGGEVK